jgi:O-antigen/teichoic acid export membrane protein
VTQAEKEPGLAPQRATGPYVVFLVVASTFGLQALTVVSGVITARVLGAEGRGVTALVFAIGLFASQLTFGGSLPIAIAKNLAERRLAARDGLRSIARRRVALLLIPCLGAGGLMLVLRRADLDAAAYALIVAAVVMTFQSLMFRILTGCLQGEIGHLGRMAVLGVLPQFLFSLFLAVAWIAGWDIGVLTVLATFFVSSFLGLAFGLLALARPTGRKEDELDEAALWADTRKTYVSSVRPIDGLGLDRILLGALAGNIALGLYAAAAALAALCSTIGSAFSIVVLPQVAMYNSDPVRQRAVVRRWLTLAAILIAVVVSAVELVVEPTIIIAFGREFEDAIPVARWLVVAGGLLGFRIVLIAVLQGQGRGGTASWIELAMAPVMVTAVVLAALQNNLPAIGIAMVSVAAISCTSLALAVARGGRRPTTRPSE